MNILVIGKAKTGTTIISKTIEHSIGSKAKYYLEPKTITFFEQKIFEQKDKSHIVKIIFEHWSDRPRMRNAICHNEATLKFKKIICIKRDFLDEIISRFMYILFPHSIKQSITKEQLDLWIGVLQEKEINPEQVSFIAMIKKMKDIFGIDFLANVNSCVKSSIEYAHFIDMNKSIVHIVEYENFINDKIDELEKYLGFSLNGSQDVGELSYTARSKTFNNWKTFFTKKDVEFFQKIINKNSVIRENNDWELIPCDSLAPIHFSKYIQRILSQRIVDK